MCRLPRWTSVSGDRSAPRHARLARPLDLPLVGQLSGYQSHATSTLVASALGWLDGANRVGELEPVGTDPRFARRGLGWAVSLACLHTMRDAGATRAVVYPRGDSHYPVAKRLHYGLGFRPIARTITYGR